MLKLIKYSSILIAMVSVFMTSGVAEAHTLKTDNGFSAVMHIDPDDDPIANQPTVINFLIDNEKRGYTQTDYRNSLTISANGKQLQKIPVEQIVFGNAGDGAAKYTFPGLNVYTLDLRGTLISDPSVSFHMTYLVRVAGSAGGGPSTTRGNGSQIIILGIGSLIIVGMIGFTLIRQGRRYAPAPRLVVKKS